MLFKKLGRSSTVIPVIGQGTNLDHVSSSHSQYGRSVAIIKAGIESGLTLIDTAPVYGAGAAEEAVEEATRGVRDKAFIATKIASENVAREGVISSLEASLRRLGTEYVDLLQIHWSNPTVPIRETMETMSMLVEQGKVKHVGVSNFSLVELKEAREALAPLPLSSIQVEYNLYERTIEENILPYCEEHAISVIAYSPLTGGKIAGRANRAQTLETIAKKYGKTSAQVALKWLVTHGPVVVIPNTTKPERVTENAEAADFDLLDTDIEEIDRVCAVQQMTVPTESIRVSADAGRPVYQTVDEAVENRLNMVPSPVELAEEMKDGKFLKPVRLVRSTSKEYTFNLIEGRLRYWAWVIAHDGKEPIAAIIEDA